jgi:glucose uptake protein GlcU
MTGNAALGIMGVLVAAVGWGSNFIVVKGYDMKDGFVFQFWLCTGILLFGLVSCFFASADSDYGPFSGGLGALKVELPLLGVLGGFLWSMGNLCTVAIISNIGLGLGLSIWSGLNLILSFVVGLSGPCIGSECLAKPHLTSVELGVLGCITSVLSLIAFGFVKPVLKDTEVLVDNIDGFDPATDSGAPSKIKGITLAIVAGVLYGFQFLPSAIYGQFHNPDSTLIGQVRFFFSQYVGIWFGSFLAYSVYTVAHAVRGTEPPFVPLRAMLPAILCGVVWAVAGSGTMIAVAELGYSVGFPLCLNGAFLVNIMWSVLYFKEVRGKRDLQLFAVAAGLDVVGSVMIALSK